MMIEVPVPEATMARWEGFTQCPGCGFDVKTGDGSRSCSYGDCPYLPDELDVYCPDCRFNFFTMEGNPPCDEPMTCEHAVEARGHVENLRVWAAQQGPPPAGIA
jgi:hypothetical protein